VRRAGCGLVALAQSGRAAYALVFVVVVFVVVPVVAMLTASA
jgi:hypothetical protein